MLIFSDGAMVISQASTAKPAARPYLDVENPQNMPYSTKYNFKKVNVEKVIKGSKDGKVTVELNDIKLKTTRGRKVVVTVSLYYRSENGKYWKCPKSCIKRVTVTGKQKDFKLTFKIPKGSMFYVRLTKNKHINNRVTGSLRIRD